MAGDTRWLLQKGRTWYAVKEVPRALRRKLGRRLIVSLKTHDKAVAVARRHAALAEFERKIEAARSEASPDPIIEAGMVWRRSLALLRQGDPAGTRAFGGHDETRWSAQHHSDVPVSARAVAEENASILLDDAFEDIADIRGPEAAHAFLGLATGTATPLLHHVEGWLAEGGAKGPLNPRTQEQYRADLKRLEAWARASSVPTTVEAFTREVAGRFVQECLIAPALNRATANRRISAVSAYWRWLQRRVGIKENPWSNQSLSTNLRRHGNGKVKRPYTDAEVAALLSGPADQETADAMRVAALTGARLEEIYRLTTADCEGGWFNIRQSKSVAGVRRVPIHPDLVAIVERRCTGKVPDAFLFDEAGPANKRRERSAAFSKRFGHYRRALAIEDRTDGQRHSRVDFHSFRRWFVTKARNAGHDLAVVRAVVGHEAGNLTDDVYSGGPSEERLRACVASVRLPL